MPLHVLTDSDVQVLKKVVRQVLNEQLGIGLGEDVRTNQASDVYLAKVPSTGIPGLTVASPDDIPGYAVCDFYKLTPSATGTGAGDKVVANTGLRKRVYNLSTVPITTRYALAIKLKGGRYVGRPIDDPTVTTGTGTGTSCITTVDGITLLDLPTGSGSYALVVTSDGCLRLMPIGSC